MFELEKLKRLVANPFFWDGSIELNFDTSAEDMKETRTRTILIEDVNPEVVAKALRFMYTGEVGLGSDLKSWKTWKNYNSGPQVLICFGFGYKEMSRFFLDD